MSKLQFLLDELSPYLKPKRKTASLGLQVNDKTPMLFAVHGTNTSPDTWRGSEVALDSITKYFGFKPTHTTYDLNFSWSKFDDGKNTGYNHTFNGIKARGKAANLLEQYILNAYASRLTAMQDRNWHAVQNDIQNNPIILVAHSHGGNVCIQLLKQLQKFGIKVYLCTLSTPVYSSKEENPANVKKAINEHAHFWAESDKVQGFLAGKEVYVNSFTKNHHVPTKVGHSFQHRDKHPEFLAACVNYYAQHKNSKTVSTEFKEQLGKKYPKVIWNKSKVKPHLQKF